MKIIIETKVDDSSQWVEQAVITDNPFVISRFGEKLSKKEEEEYLSRTVKVLTPIGRIGLRENPKLWAETVSKTPYPYSRVRLIYNH